MSTTISITIRK